MLGKKLSELYITLGLLYFSFGIGTAIYSTYLLPIVTIGRRLSLDALYFSWQILVFALLSISFFAVGYTIFKTKEQVEKIRN